jgi:hypothetical protein
LQQFDSVLWMAFTGFHERYIHGLSVDEVIQTLVGQPGAIEYWGVYATSFPEDFRAHITHLLH